MRRFAASTLLTVVASGVWAQPEAPRQTQEDDYTRYELLAPDSARFRIYYEVTATTAGAKYFFNTIRRGSVATDERVADLSTGQPLEWEVVSGKEARTTGHPDADPDTDYIKVHLSRPVPQGGEVRLLIDKTYTDAKSYYRDGDAIVFDRSLGIRRNAVVLPPGYRLVSCNVPSQIIPTSDGRVQVSFMNPGPAAAPLVIRAMPGLAPFTPALSGTRGPASLTSLASEAVRLGERAHQDREIVYFLNDPATSSFSLYHDYTESRSGVRHYFNVVRAGSRVSNPSARSLDTGEALKVETLTGAQMTARALDPGEPIAVDGEVVVVSFDPVRPGHSTRLRIAETYTDPTRYRVDGEELVWDRAFGRPRNTVVLPAGWTVVANAIPATIGEDTEGRQRLYFENARPDEIQTLIRARRIR
ncbi:MAG: hypothetical protein ACT4QD_04685 [Acidobacteriota bacterium]